MKFLAILRGINVGGKRKLLMADLRSMLEDMGYDHVSTYIQSGNAWFDYRDDEEPQRIADRIEQTIKERFGYEVPVIVLTARELDKAISTNPYYQSQPGDIGMYHLTFLSTIPDPTKAAEIQAMDFKPDQFHLQGKNAFLRCENKYHKTKLSNAFFEKKLSVKATTRNWKTVLKLAELMRDQ